MIGAILLFSLQPSEAPAAGRPVLEPVRLEESDRITVDGTLDEAVWQRARPATNFLQRDPDNGSPSTERTEVRAVFDSHRIVLGVTCFDSAAR